MLESSTSSTVGHNAASAPSLNNVAHDVGMCNFATDTAARVRRLISIIADAVAIAELCHETVNRGIVRSVRVGA
jgi:hypothetical protein